MITSPGNVSSENLHKLLMVMPRMMTQMVHKLAMLMMMTNKVFKLIMVITKKVTPKVLLLKKRNLMVEKSSKTGGVSFTSSTVRRI